MNEALKMIAVLTMFCALSSVTLASLKDATENRVEEQVLTYVQGPAITQVLNDFTNSPVKDRKSFQVPDTDTKITVFPAMTEGKLTEIAMETSSKGYGGEVGVMVGFKIADGSISGIGITTMKETPGIGARVAKHGFTSQFHNHSDNVELTAKGGDIDGISGATISSTASVEAVKKAIIIFKKIKPQLETAWTQGS